MTRCIVFPDRENNAWRYLRLVGGSKAQRQYDVLRCHLGMDGSPKWMNRAHVQIFRACVSSICLKTMENNMNFSNCVTLDQKTFLTLNFGI